MQRQEPYNRAEWNTGNRGGQLYTCGRPGRGSIGTRRIRVTDEVIDSWVDGLPHSQRLHIVSLLGQKPDGWSEFGYYPFKSEHEAGVKPTFQEWLNHRYGSRFVVHEFPTKDRMGVPPERTKEVVMLVLDLLSEGCTVVIVDSAGAERTARICEAAGFRKAANHGP